MIPIAATNDTEIVVFIALFTFLECVSAALDSAAPVRRSSP